MHFHNKGDDNYYIFTIEISIDSAMIDKSHCIIFSSEAYLALLFTFWILFINRWTAFEVYWKIQQAFHMLWFNSSTAKTGIFKAV